MKCDGILKSIQRQNSPRKNQLACTYSIISFPGSNLPHAYEAMIYGKWLRSLRYSNDYFKLINAEAFFVSYHKYIALLLCRPDTLVMLAVLTDDPDVVLGWSVVEGKKLHYVHVHKDHRRTGIGRKLIPKNIDTITHLTKDGMFIWANKYPDLVFNPFA